MKPELRLEALIAVAKVDAELWLLKLRDGLRETEPRSVRELRDLLYPTEEWEARP